MTNLDEDRGISGLLVAIQELSAASSLADIQRVARTGVRSLAGCDGATFVLRDGDLCYYADEDAISPLWKGMRFPMETCISGWAMLKSEPAIIPDIYVDPRIPHDAYRPTFVKSLVMMPIRTVTPIGALGAYWADHHDATDDEVALLRALAEATSLALEKVSVREELQREVAMTKEAFLLSQTDDLTGLLNRRGFTSEVLAQFDDADGGAIAFVDVNGLKQVNDFQGHLSGDLLIQRVADRISHAVRPTDLVGRLGGDEFAVFALGTDASVLKDRLTLALGGLASVGAEALTVASGLADALLAADADMYEAKRAARADTPARQTV